MMLTLSGSIDPFLQNSQNMNIKFYLFVEKVVVHKTRKMYNWGKGMFTSSSSSSSNLKNKEKKNAEAEKT